MLKCRRVGDIVSASRRVGDIVSASRRVGNIVTDINIHISPC